MCSSDLGPAREVHAGSGYWSMDSSVQVLGVLPQLEALWIRWPGGRVTTTPLKSGLGEAVIGPDGTLISFH